MPQPPPSLFAVSSCSSNKVATAVFESADAAWTFEPVNLTGTAINPLHGSFFRMALSSRSKVSGGRMHMVFPPCIYPVIKPHFLFLVRRRAAADVRTSPLLSIWELLRPASHWRPALWSCSQAQAKKTHTSCGSSHLSSECDHGSWPIR